MASKPVAEAFDRIRPGGPLWVGGLVSLALFLFSIQLLGTVTEAMAVPLREVFGRYVAGDGRTLGVSWVATYLLANGSVVAALSVSLFKADVISTTQLYLMVAGSRLGAAAIVVLIGALDYLQKRRYTLGKGIGLGVLTFLLTHTIYLPTTMLGYLALPRLEAELGVLGRQLELSARPFAGLDPVTGAIVDGLGHAPSLVLSIVVLLGALNLFDRVLRRVDTRWLRRRLFRLFRGRFVALLMGILLTGITTSVAFSLGVFVPLYNRGYLDRRKVVPYVLGANIGTLFDTVVVAVVLESSVGVTIVLSFLAIGTLFTIGALLLFEEYFDFVDALQTRIVEDRRFLAAFLLVLGVGPVLLAIVPF